MKFDFFRKRKSGDFKEIIGEDVPEIEEEEREMIRGVFELGQTPVNAIMVPRTDVVALDVDLSFGKIVSLVVESGHSRIPLYEDTIDNVIGFLYAKDLITHLMKKAGSVNVRKILRPVLFVPEGKLIDELLREFRQKKVHIAVVVDEYGGMAGIVSLEDVLEEIVGEIQDEYDDEEEGIKPIGTDSWLCDARTLIVDLAEKIGVSLPCTESDTVGGFVFNLFGKVPKVRDTIRCEQYVFSVEKMQGRRIKQVKIVLEHGKDGAEAKSD